MWRTTDCLTKCRLSDPHQPHSLSCDFLIEICNISTHISISRVKLYFILVVSSDWFPVSSSFSSSSILTSNNLKSYFLWHHDSCLSLTLYPSWSSVFSTRVVHQSSNLTIHTILPCIYISNESLTSIHSDLYSLKHSTDDLISMIATIDLKFPYVHPW
jgi:hypothetical protein